MSIYASIEVGDDHVTLMRSGHTSGAVARILDKTVDADGRVTALVLDRVITDRWVQINGWSHSGVVATELVRRDH